MPDVKDLLHIEHAIPSGGKVVVLDTGSTIDPEAQAMLAALHSRSIGGISDHLRILAEKGAANFMSRFYVGYGHKSIGDLGSISVFIEGISMLAAKAIQDVRLYNGQESSTRYIDFAHQPFIDPLATAASSEVLEAWRTFYLRGLAVLPPVLTARYPMKEGENPVTYEKAIMARAFDIMRAFLPAGASTNLTWHGPLRVFGDRLAILRHHPLPEVRSVGETLELALLEAFPNSFSDKRYETTESYLEEAVPELSYLTLPDCPEFAVTRDSLDRELLTQHAHLLTSRPAKTELPKFFDEAGELQFTYLLDFGSFRDIQRHRAVAQRMPILTTDFGFHSWYLDEMSEELRSEALEIIEKQKSAIGALSASPEIAQYYTAMGFLTANRLTGTLPGLVYLAELRSGSTVHPTLRLLAQRMGEALEQALGAERIALYLDKEANRFDVRRGEHDIVRKT